MNLLPGLEWQYNNEGCFDIGDALHIEDVKLPEGIKAEQDSKLTIAVVMAPTVAEAEEAEEEEEEGEEEAEKEAAEPEAPSE